MDIQGFDKYTPATARPVTSVSDIRRTYKWLSAHLYPEYAGLVKPRDPTSIAFQHSEFFYSPYLVFAGGGTEPRGITVEEFEAISLANNFDPLKFYETMMAISDILEARARDPTAPLVAGGDEATYMALAGEDYFAWYGVTRAETRDIMEERIIKAATGATSVEFIPPPDLPGVFGAPPCDTTGRVSLFNNVEPDQRISAHDMRTIHHPWSLEDDKAGDSSLSDDDLKEFPYSNASLFHNFSRESEPKKAKIDYEMIKILKDAANFRYSGGETIFNRIDDPELSEAAEIVDGIAPREPHGPAGQCPETAIPSGDLASSVVGRLYTRELEAMLREVPAPVPHFEGHYAPAGVSMAQLADSPIGCLVPINPIMRGQLEKIPGYFRAGGSGWRRAHFNVMKPKKGSGIAIELDQCPFCGLAPTNPVTGKTSCRCSQMDRVEGFGRAAKRPMALGGYRVESIEHIVCKTNYDKDVRRALVALRTVPCVGRGRWNRYHPVDFPDRTVWDMFEGAATESALASTWDDYDNAEVAFVYSTEMTQIFWKLVQYGVLTAYLTPVDDLDQRHSGWLAWLPEIGAHAISYAMDPGTARCWAMVAAFHRWYFAQGECISPIIRLLLAFGGGRVRDELYAFLYGWGRDVVVRNGDGEFASLSSICVGKVACTDVIALARQGATPRVKADPPDAVPLHDRSKPGHIEL
jgi:hypothetical protein